MTKRFVFLCAVLTAAFWMAPVGVAQQAAPPQAPAAPAPQGSPATPPPPQPRTPDIEVVRDFDRDGNGWLNLEERTEARARVTEIRAARRAARGLPTPPAPAAPPPPVPGRRLTPADVPSLAGTPLYDERGIRTIFLEFEHDTWEEELEAFYHTDVELPATMRVDGKTYANVGIQFRGNSSFGSVSRGRKRSLSVTMDHVDAKQQLEGYRALTLLNSFSDPTFLRSVLYLDLARQYLPALKVNYVRVVINGESWGVYVNQQRYTKDFLREAFGTEAGTRFKSSNRSRFGSFSYLGDSVAEYRKWYEIQGPDRDALWSPLMNVTRVLAQTPPDRLKAAIEPILNVDGALRYLALDMVVMSGDGYWLWGSDFNLYVDPRGVLHILHHDANEAFMARAPSAAQGAVAPGPGVPPAGAPQAGPGAAPPADAKADPLGYMDDPNKALRHKLLAVPEYRTKYLQYVRDIARDALDWAKLGPKVEAHRALIKADVEADTRKVYSTEEFTAAVYGKGEDVPPPTTLKGFILQRREYLLSHPAIAALPR